MNPVSCTYIYIKQSIANTEDVARGNDHWTPQRSWHELARSILRYRTLTDTQVNVSFVWVNCHHTHEDKKLVFNYSDTGRAASLSQKTNKVRHCSHYQHHH